MIGLYRCEHFIFKGRWKVYITRQRCDVALPYSSSKIFYILSDTRCEELNLLAFLPETVREDFSEIELAFRPQK
jgi:hypothetical protein